MPDGAPSPPSSPSAGWASTAAIWTLEHLPRLNRLALRRHLRAEQLATLVNRHLLAHAPPADRLASHEVPATLLVLGLLGSSVERHAQEQQLSAGHAPGEAEVVAGSGIVQLRMGSHQFTGEFAAVADRLGHPHRDSFTSLVEYNGPAVEVRDPAGREVIHVVPAGPAGQRFLTFSGTRSERNFYTLLKETFGLQVGCNHYLLEVHESAAPLSSEWARRRVAAATSYLRAIRQEMVKFTRTQEFDTTFFLDELRQYQCSWGDPANLRPPSAANDAAAVLRDLILFDELLGPGADDGFPGFRRHALVVGEVSAGHDRRSLVAAMRRPSLETRLVVELGLSRQWLATMAEGEATATRARCPWLAEYLDLYTAQRDLSRTHIGLIVRYLVRPQQARMASGVDRATVVDNGRGVSGMAPGGVLARLDDARRQHLLARLVGRS